MRFVFLVVFVGALMVGCSGQRVPVAEELPKVGSTGVDQPETGESFLGAGKTAQGGEAGSTTADFETGDKAVLDGASGDAARGRKGMQLGIKLFPTMLSETPPTSRDASASRVLSLEAAEAVEKLHSLGFTGQDACGSSQFIPDYAEAEELTYAVVTSDNAALTARDVAEAVWEYYAFVARSHEQPTPQGLLCLAQVAIQPKLEWKWADLRELISGEASVSYLLPEEVHVVGLMAGNALAVACLPPQSYGELSQDDAPIAATLLLRWAGDRWRVSVAEDFGAEVRESPYDFCESRLSAVRAEFEDDTADTGERWRFGEWRFTADELSEIMEGASITEEVLQ